MPKKIKIIIFASYVIFTSLFLTSKVFAFTNGEKIGHDYYDHLKTYSNALNSSCAVSYYSLYHHYTYYNGDKYTLFCLDGARPGGGANADLRVSRVLDQNNPVDAVILYMMSEPGYSEGARIIAIRAFEVFSGEIYEPRFISYEIEGACANMNSGIEWGAGGKYARKHLKAIFNLKDDSESTIRAFAKPRADIYYGRVGSDGKKHCNSKKKMIDSKVIEAEDLFDDALLYGYSVATGEKVTKKELVTTNPVFTKDKYDIVVEDGVTKAVREITFSQVFKKFNDGTTNPVKVVITPDTKGVATATSYEYKVSGTNNWISFNSSTDFKPLLDKESVMIDFRVKVKAVVNSTATITLSFKVDTQYKEDKIRTGALLKNVKNVSPATQRFYIYDTSTTKHSPFTATMKWDNLSGYCLIMKPDKSKTDELKQYMKSCCLGGNETGYSVIDDCETELKKAKTDVEKQNILNSYQACKVKTEYCDICNGSVSVPQTCSELGDGEVPKCEDNADAVVKDNDNVKLCIIDYADQARNDYKLTTDSNVESNEYCNVYCKEDYKLSLPLGRWVTSGRSFAIAMNVNATKSCYTDLINYDKFITDLNAQKTLLDDNPSNMIARNNYKRIVNQYKACAEASWKSDIKFKPDISLTYDESDYIKGLGKVTFEQTSKIVNGKEVDSYSVSNDNIWLCSGNDVDDYYNECKNGTAVGSPDKQVYQTLSNYYDPETFKKTDLKIPLTKYAKKVSFASAIYAPKPIFYTNAGNGTITTNSSSSLNKELSVDLNVNGEIAIGVGKLPIALKRPTGAYKFNIYFNNVGEYFNSNNLGRLVGGTNSVALKNGDTKFKAEYACSYTVNCPECKVSCVEDPKNGIFCSTSKNYTPPTCITCKISPFNDGDSYNLFVARQISLSNINPSSRRLGANLTGLKGRTAVKDIEENGETIYNSDGKPEYSITLTPSETKKLQQYNNMKINSGGYASLDDFECKLYSEMVDRSSLNAEEYEQIKKYDYVVCKSKLLNNGNSSSYKLSNVEINNNDNVSWIEACNNSSDNPICIVGGFYGPAYK